MSSYVKEFIFSDMIKFFRKSSSLFFIFPKIIFLKKINSKDLSKKKKKKIIFLSQNSPKTQNPGKSVFFWK